MQIKTAKAAILAQSRAPLIVDEIALPETLGVGQVLVKVLYSTICGAQINEIAAAKGPDKFLPHLLGHEASARVLEIGPGVTTVKPGDTVVLHWRPSDGIQCQPPAYTWRGKKLNAGWVTTFNEYAVISENRMTVIAPDYDLRNRAAARLRRHHRGRRHQQRRRREDRRVGCGVRRRRRRPQRRAVRATRRRLPDRRGRSRRQQTRNGEASAAPRTASTRQRPATWTLRSARSSATRVPTKSSRPPASNR